MQAIRRVGPSSRPLSSRPLSFRPLSFSSHRSVSHASEKGKGSASLGESIIPISNIEAQWNAMTDDEQALVHRQLEELQKKDWKGLSLDEKRAAYFVSFGPHGNRTPHSPPGEPQKIVLGVVIALGVTSLLWATSRSYAHEPPKSMTKEYQQLSNEKALEQKQNPLTGIASEGYKGKGHIQSK